VKIVFLLEDESMCAALEEGLLPRIVPQGIFCKCFPHRGKTDLEKSIVDTIQNWREPGVHFVVLQDKDSKDCRKVKANLVDLCAEAGRPDTLIRVACCELESWFLGDLAAVEKALGLKGLANRQGQAKFRDPDALNNASQELKKLAPGYNKVRGARAIGAHLSLEDNRSRSFQAFVAGLRRLAGTSAPE
jgi:hypothetical protein